MKKVLFWMGLALLLSACNREALNTDPAASPSGRHTIYAQVSETPESRVSITDAGTPEWQQGDAIALYDGTQFVTFTLTDATTGAFEGPEGNYTGLAVFPAEFAGSVSETGELTLNLPAEYQWKEGQTFAPMIAVSESDTFCFYPVSGLMKFTYTSIPADVTKLRFGSDSRINGAFAVGTPAPGTSVIAQVSAQSDPEKFATVKIPAGHPATMTFYLPLPVSETGYHGFSVSLSGDDGVPAAEIASSTTFSLTRNEMRRYKSKDCADALPAKIYLIGDCLDPSWGWSEENALVKGEGAVYTGSINLTQNGGFKMYLNNDWSATWLSIDETNSSSDNLIVVGGEAYKAAHGVGDTQVRLNNYGYVPGRYTMTVDLFAKRMTLEAEASGPDRLYLHGGCFSPKWDFSDDLTLDKTSTGIYEGDITIVEANSWEGFKIWTDKNWTKWYGAATNSTYDEIIIVDGAAYIAEQGIEDAQIYPVTLGYAPGKYHMTLNLNTMRLTMTLTGGDDDSGPEKYYLNGAAFDESWGWPFAEDRVVTKVSSGVYKGTAYMYLDHENRGFKIYGQMDWGPVVYSADLSSGSEFRILDEDNEQFYPYRHGYTTGTYEITVDFNQMRVFLEAE